MAIQCVCVCVCVPLTFSLSSMAMGHLLCSSMRGQGSSLTVMYVIPMCSWYVTTKGLQHTHTHTHVHTCTHTHMHTHKQTHTALFSDHKQESFRFFPPSL